MTEDGWGPDADAEPTASGMNTPSPASDTNLPPDEEAPEQDLPEWEDDYLTDVAERLKFNYDLSKEYHAGGEQFPLYGRLFVESHKQFFHPSLNYANHSAVEHLFTERVARPSVRDVERLVDLGHDLADDDAWLDPDEEHQQTDFTFVLVSEEVPEEVQSFVDGFRERTLLKYGFYGHYEIHLVVVAPDPESVVASEEVDVWRAFAPWADDGLDEDRGLLGRVASLFGR
jgi:hypothetical protein